MTDRPPPTAVRKALELINQFVTSSENEITRLTKNDDKLKKQLDALTQRVQNAERQAFEAGEEARRASGKLTDANKRLEDAKTHANNTRNVLMRRIEDAEERAQIYGQRAGEFETKARLTEEMQEAAEKLLTTLDRLPLSMDDASIVRSDALPEIPLYGTHDWKNVMDAKFALVSALKKGEAS